MVCSDTSYGLNTLHFAAKSGSKAMVEAILEVVKEDKVLCRVYLANLVHSVSATASSLVEVYRCHSPLIRCELKTEAMSTIPSSCLSG